MVFPCFDFYSFIEYSWFDYYSYVKRISLTRKVTKEMPEFLKIMPRLEARDLFLKNLPEFTPEAEEIETASSDGRVLAEDVFAPNPLPEFDCSTMDGYAVRAADTFGASETLPMNLTVIGEILMGQKTSLELSPACAALIHTGGMLPKNANAVVMVEYTQSNRKGEVEILRPVAPLENIIQAGEDVHAGQLVIPRCTRIRSAEIGGLMAFGKQSVRVARKPRIGVLSSGDEVIPVDNTPSIGQVRDINSHTLANLIDRWGGEAVQYGIVPDNAGALKNELDRCLEECDGVIVTAGSSASARDLTSQVIQEAGQPGVLVHGINIRPGKPTILAMCDGKPVIGLPGNPISAIVVSWLFVPEMLMRMQGNTVPVFRSYLSAKLAVNTSSLAGREDWVPVKITGNEPEYHAEPIFFKSNLIFNLASSDGLMYIPPAANGLNAGEMVRVYIM
jgi:molybdopterin molybdotransferase